MKYIMICIAALLMCLGIGFGITIPVRSRLTSRYRKATSGLLILVAGMLAFFAVMIIYLEIYYKAEPSAFDALEGNETVEVTKIDGGYLFDGPEDSSAMVFYPGAKVEAVAYAPLLLEFAEKGIDCFLAEMPFRMAVFKSNAADQFIDEYPYEEWVVGGHSLGGSMAANYAESNADKVDGLVLLESYPTKELSDDLWMCSVYGSNDGCLDQAEYEKNKEKWPTDSEEIYIEGGNHAQVGEYGEQRGDEKAEISADEQRQQTVEEVIEFMEHNNKD